LITMGNNESTIGLPPCGETRNEGLVAIATACGRRAVRHAPISPIDQMTAPRKNIHTRRADRVVTWLASTIAAGRGWKKPAADDCQCILTVIAHRRHRSSLETVLIVPAEGLRIGIIANLVWRADHLTVKRVIVPAVFKLLLDAPAHLEIETRRHRDVARVK